MTTEWKLVPVEPTEEMLMAFDENCDGLDPEIAQSQWQKILAAAPVPSAGAVEVNHQYLCKGLYERWMPLQESEVEDAKREGFQVRELVDRAHVTRLTAENARLQAELKEALRTSVKEDVFDVVCKERDALKAEVGFLMKRASELKTERDGLQSELTKARELLNQWLNMFEGGLKSGDLDSLWNETADYVDPTINQSAPAANREHILYRDGDSIGCIPESILDRNGQVALDMCTVCGKAEAELNGPCGGSPVAKGEPDA